MQEPLRILIVEDSGNDAALLLGALERGGFQTTHRLVQTEAAMREALAAGSWDLVVSDFAMPAFSASAALDVLRQSGVDAPFIIVSGTIGEDTAVDALKAGAEDFLVKGRLSRFVPAVRRALAEAQSRRRRAETEEALRASEERFRTLVSSMDDMVFTLDATLRYDGLFGKWPVDGPLSPAKLRGRTARESLGAAAADAHETAAASALAGGRTVYEWSVDHGGGVRSFSTSLSPRRDAAGKVVGLVGIHRDITDALRLQAQLVSSDRLASVGLLAASVGHEINNPLSSLLANLELVERDASHADSGMREALADAREAALRIGEIVSDLRMFSRETQPNAHLDLHRVLESSLRMARAEVRHRARLLVHLAPLPPVEGSLSRLGQVFLNLIVNAAQALDDRGAEHNEIRVTAHTDADGWAVIEVADSGCGIPSDSLGHVFAPFFTTKPEGVGTGLGLSICKRTVESMGGAISVTSVLGEGSAFRVRLPPVRSPAIASASTASHAPTRARRRGRVLIVDDERIVAAAVQRCLRPDHDVTTTVSAKEALSRVLGGERYDVIICDLMMPEMSGMQLHDEIVRVAPDQSRRMVFLTGGAFTAKAQQFLERVDNPRVDKPFDVPALRALVNDYVTRSP